MFYIRGGTLVGGPVNCTVLFPVLVPVLLAKLFARDGLGIVEKLISLKINVYKFGWITPL